MAKEAGPSASTPSQGRAEKEADSSETEEEYSGESSEEDSEDEASSPFGAVAPLPVSTPVATAAPLGGATHSAVAEGQQEEEAMPHVVVEGPANSPNAAECVHPGVQFRHPAVSKPLMVS